MHLYRLCLTKYLSSAFSGIGAHDNGGRWNSKGFHCVYMGESRSVCLLETLAHIQASSALNNFSMLSVEVDESLILKVDENDLPEDWRSYPAPDKLAEIGNDWLSSNASPILLVPSVISLDFCALLNPKHPESASIIDNARDVPFTIDLRLIHAK